MSVIHSGHDYAHITLDKLSSNVYRIMTLLVFNLLSKNNMYFYKIYITTS